MNKAELALVFEETVRPLLQLIEEERRARVDEAREDASRWQATRETIDSFSAATHREINLIASALADQRVFVNEMLEILKRERQADREKDLAWLKALNNEPGSFLLSNPVVQELPGLPDGTEEPLAEKNTSRAKGWQDALVELICDDIRSGGNLWETIRGKSVSLDNLMKILPKDLGVSRSTLGRIRPKIQAGEWDKKISDCQ